MKIFTELSQLVFPTRCFGCNHLGLSICTSCRREWIPHHYRTDINSFHVYSAVLYTDTASKIILAAKENGIRGADNLVISAILHVLNKNNVDRSCMTLVPVPSSKQSQRRRGRSFIVDLTQQISQTSGIAMKDCLEVSRRVSDQSGLTKKQRSLNMQGAFSLKNGTHLRGDVVLIDDVVTTGATLREAARALNSQGSHPFGTVSSVTACVAQPLR